MGLLSYVSRFQLEYLRSIQKLEYTSVLHIRQWSGPQACRMLCEVRIFSALSMVYNLNFFVQESEDSDDEESEEEDSEEENDDEEEMEVEESSKKRKRQKEDKKAAKKAKVEETGKDHGLHNNLLLLINVLGEFSLRLKTAFQAGCGSICMHVSIDILQAGGGGGGPKKKKKNK